jgi:hypothetical protein
MPGLVMVTAAGTRQARRPASQPATAWHTGLSLSGSGCGYRDRDRRDPASELAMDTSLPSSGISSSPAR